MRAVVLNDDLCVFTPSSFGKSAAEDHYDVLLPPDELSTSSASPPPSPPPLPPPQVAPKFQLHAALSSRLVQVPFEVCECQEMGRGLKSLADFEIDDPIGPYDGVRVDRYGRIVFCRPHLRALFDRFPQIDRERNATVFQRSHAARLRIDQDCLFIDGHPLSDPCLDGIPEFTRMRLSLANSSSPRDANMKPVFAEAPDLQVLSVPGGLQQHPTDSCEMFLVAKKRIRCVSALARKRMF